jgi:formamidopyrimidine-DNA glycosylase
MLECPEVTTIAAQMHAVLPGKRVESAVCCATPHKFAFLNRPAGEYSAILAGKQVGEILEDGSRLCLTLNPGWLLMLGEVVGRVLYHPAGAVLPPKHQLLLQFTDGSALTLTISMWAAIHLLPQDSFADYTPWKNRRPNPLNPAFSWEYFQTILADPTEAATKSVKRMMVSKPNGSSVANGCLHDILFRAGLNPRHLVKDLTPAQQHALFEATVLTVRLMTEAGGRDCERDLYNQPGGYHGILGAWSAGQPCPQCGNKIVKIAYLGGSSYYCPTCQV